LIYVPKMLIEHSITYRIAVGPRAGQKVFTLHSVAAPDDVAGHNGAAQAGGFSLHAGLDIHTGQRTKLERLCRYVSRPPLALDRLALSVTGQVRYTLKTPYRDGTTHIVLEPLDFVARLAALVPPPRMHLTPIPRGIRAAQRIASIEEPAVIARILAHLDRTTGATEPKAGATVRAGTAAAIGAEVSSEHGAGNQIHNRPCAGCTGSGMGGVAAGARINGVEGWIHG
jgi:hypothetical protein